jgi:DNA replication protein DnaC
VKTTDDASVDVLVEKLRWLRLPGMAAAVSELLQRAADDNLTVGAVISRLCDEEKHSRIRSSVDRRIKDARFPEINTVDAFDFDFDPARKKLRSRYLALHDLSFLANGTNPLFIGIPGTGKTFLARALAYRACQAQKRVVFTSAARMLTDLHGAEIHGSLDRALRRYVRTDLLAIDDFAVLAMDPAQAKLAYQVIAERYEYRRSTLITTNRPFKEWTRVFPDALTAQVMAERLTEALSDFCPRRKGLPVDQNLNRPACSGRNL